MHGFPRSRKGQAALEYLMVFGLALILSAPFVLRAQGQIIDLRSSSNAVDMHNSLNKFESSIKTVSAAGKPARRTFTVQIPDNVESAQLNSNSIVYSLQTPEGIEQVSRSFETSLTGDIPSSNGRHRVSVSATDSGVKLEVVS